MCDAAPDNEQRCAACILTKLENACESSPEGRLLMRAVDLRRMMNAGVTITMDDVSPDELDVLLLIEQHRDRLDKENEPSQK